MRRAIRELNEKIVENTHRLDQSILKKHIEALTKLLQVNDLTFFEKGWVYWQMQDHYGLLRDYYQLELVFKVFIHYLKSEQPNYLMWAVCDMTQVLTLRLGNKDKLWEEIVNECNKKVYHKEDLVKIQFEMNRAYFGIVHDERVVLSIPKMQNTLMQLKNIIESNQSHPDILYFNLNYYSLCIKFVSYKNGSITNIFELLLKEISTINEALNEPKQESSYLFGSWEDITSSKGAYNASVGITNVLFALEYSGRYDLIKSLLNEVPNYKIVNKRLLEKLGDIV